jgi:hypothetical protein
MSANNNDRLRGKQLIDLNESVARLTNEKYDSDFAKVGELYFLNINVPFYSFYRFEPYMAGVNVEQLGYYGFDFSIENSLPIVCSSEYKFVVKKNFCIQYTNTQNNEKIYIPVGMIGKLTKFTSDL